MQGESLKFFSPSIFIFFLVSAYFLLFMMVPSLPLNIKKIFLKYLLTEGCNRYNFNVALMIPGWLGVQG